MPSWHIHTGYANSTGYRPLVDESGVSGMLIGLGIAGGSNTHWIKVKIDDQVQDIVNERFSISQGTRENVALGGLNIPFSNKLEVQICDQSPTAIPRFWAVFRKDGSQFISEKFNLEVYDEVPYCYVVTEFKADDGRLHRDKRSWGCAQVSEVKLKKDSFRKPEPIEGSVELKEWDRNSDPRKDKAWPSRRPEQEITLGIRVAGRIDPFEYIKTKLDGTFAEKVELPSGTFEIGAILEGYANIPATFAVL